MKPHEEFASDQFKQAVNGNGLLLKLSTAHKYAMHRIMMQVLEETSRKFLDDLLDEGETKAIEMGRFQVYDKLRKMGWHKLRRRLIREEMRNNRDGEATEKQD